VTENSGGFLIRTYDRNSIHQSDSLENFTAAARPGAMKSSAQAASSTSPDASTITSSDFLTLLVSELQNQDPTEPTDPNAYITQLVGVNSLQQLISIDQGVTALEPTTTTHVSRSSSAELEGYANPSAS
jgi:flagellar hook assembly protein FlgD